MKAEDLARDKEPKPQTTNPTTRRNRALKSLKNSFLVLRCNPHPLVFDQELRPAILRAHRDLNGFARAIFDGVTKEIGYDLLDPVAIPASPHGVFDLHLDQASRRMKLCGEILPELLQPAGPVPSARSGAKAFHLRFA